MKQKKVFFISECFLNQNIRAEGASKGNTKDLINILMENDYGITVVPCPEIIYEGLKRKACGKAAYDNLKYRKICSKLADDIIARYKLYLNDCYKVGGFICVNGSPSCAIDYCFCNKEGTEKCKEPGIFIEEIQKKLKENNLSLNVIGVRIKDISKAIETIKTCLK